MTVKQLGPYRIEKVLGRGGMGTVYEGVHQETGQRAAIKILALGLSGDERFRERFNTEIETLKKLRHPHIVQLYGYGEYEGHLFFSMELVSGRTLQEELQAGRRFEWREVTRLGIEICGALKHAHDHGVIHRDLKPANLLLDAQEHVKLSDFGIAKLFGMTQLTGEGNVIGTADYMAPEQAEGHPATARTDLYALGTVLFALLTGKPPFSGSSLPQIIHAQRFQQPPRIADLAPQIPDELADIIESLLKKNPQERISTALAVSKRLRAMEHGLSIREVPDGEEQSAASSEDPSWSPTVVEGQRAQRPAMASRGATRVQQNPATPPPPGTQEAETMFTGAGIHLHEAPDAAAQPRADHFTVVDREQNAGSRDHLVRDDGSPLWLIALAAILVLAALVAGLFYATLPPAAKELYERIANAADEGSPDELLAVEEEMQRFQELYPRDPRAAEVADLQEEVELYRRQRQLERRLRRASMNQPLEPLEQVYVEALQLARTNPEAAVVKLQALIDVYGHNEDLDTESREVVELARQQLDPLKQAVETNSKQQRQLIVQQLEHAERLEASHPEAAADIRRGVVELYGDKSWAADLVEQARRAVR